MNRLKNKTHECNIEFVGLLGRMTCANVSIELLKYILLQRDQIPESLDTLLADEARRCTLLSDTEEKNLHRKTQNLEESSLTAMRLPTPSFHAQVNTCSADKASTNDRLRPLKLYRDNSLSGTKPISFKTKKRAEFVGSAKELIHNIEKAFKESILPIQALVFVLGSSLVTPKETYVLQLPNNHLEGVALSQEIVKKTLFKQIVTSDFIQSFDECGPSQPRLHKMHTLLLTDRASELTWFQPNPRFCIPKRGIVYNIHLTNSAVKDTSLYVADASSSFLDISGITPMDVTVKLSSPCPPAKRPRFNQSYTEAFDFDDVIWYQAPIVIKGFK